MKIKKYFKTSAKDNININETIEELLNELYKIYNGSKGRKRSQSIQMLSKKKKKFSCCDADL